MFGLDLPVAFVGQQAGIVADLGQAQVGVVLAQEQAVFGPAGHDAVGFVNDLGDQVVDQDADVGLVAAQDDRRAFLHL